MILGFKKQFRSKILDGTKIHTIRVDLHGRWHKGRTIHFYTGVRTKQCECFKVSLCTGIQTIRIDSWEKEVYVDGNRLNPENILRIAWSDGFPSPDDFFEWFKSADKSKRFFRGVLVHWTDKRY